MENCPFKFCELKTGENFPKPERGVFVDYAYDYAHIRDLTFGAKRSTFLGTISPYKFLNQSVKNSTIVTCSHTFSRA